MNISAKNLENALLAILVIMLVYVLYKRLIKILGKGEYSGTYATLCAILLNEDKSQLDIEIEMPEDSEVKLEILNTEEVIIDEQTKNLDEGKHTLSFNLKSLQAGKYQCKMTTDNQENSRYFTI